MASGFEESFDKNGFVIKAKAKFGKMKEVTVNYFNGGTYIHLSDMSKCFVDGNFDFSKSKSVSLNMEEAQSFLHYITSAQVYDISFQQAHANKPTQEQKEQQQQCQLQQQQPFQQQQLLQQQQHQQWDDCGWESNAMIAIPIQPAAAANTSNK